MSSFMLNSLINKINRIFDRHIIKMSGKLYLQVMDFTRTDTSVPSRQYSFFYSIVGTGDAIPPDVTWATYTPKSVVGCR